MSDSTDDLEGRQLALLLIFFGTIGGGLFLIGWLTSSGFLANPVTCAAIAGGACYPARFLVERFAWWNRLAPHTTKVTIEPDTQRALRGVRRQVLKDRAKLTLGRLAVLLSFVLLPLEFIGEGHPLKVFTHQTDWSDSWTDYLILAGVCTAAAALTAVPFFATIRFSRDARRSLTRAGVTTVTLTDIDARPGTPRPAYLTFEAEHRTWRLAVDSCDPAALHPGTQVQLIGPLEPHAWVALLTNPPLLPAAKLDLRTATPDIPG
jgi:hypothetical protein